MSHIQSLTELSEMTQSDSNTMFFYMKNGVEFRLTTEEICATSLIEIILQINDKNLYYKEN